MESAQESISTLNFAQLVNQCELGKSKRHVRHEAKKIEVKVKPKPEMRSSKMNSSQPQPKRKRTENPETVLKRKKIGVHR